jgi:hypothetical protein
MREAWAGRVKLDAYLFGLLFYLEDGSRTFLRKVGKPLPDYTRKIPEDSIITHSVIQLKKCDHPVYFPER